MKNIIKDTVILLIITLISGVGLGLVYNVTKAPRSEQEEKTKQEAYQNVFPAADSFGNPEEFDADAIKDYIAKADKDTKEKDSDNSNAEINADINEIVKALDKNGETLGYVITVTDNESYDGKIKFSVGVSMDKTVNGISFLDISETPGLGMRANEDDFKNQFSDKKVDYFKYTKTGSTDDQAIDALSGATITSNAVTNGASAAIYCFDFITGGGSNE